VCVRVCVCVGTGINVLSSYSTKFICFPLWGMRVCVCVRAYARVHVCVYVCVCVCWH